MQKLAKQAPLWYNAHVEDEHMVIDFKEWKNQQARKNARPGDFTPDGIFECFLHALRSYGADKPKEGLVFNIPQLKKMAESVEILKRIFPDSEVIAEFNELGSFDGTIDVLDTYLSIGDKEIAEFRRVVENASNISIDPSDKEGINLEFAFRDIKILPMPEN